MKKANLKIGEFTVNTPFLLAPLAGITDRAMRSLCSEAGASLTYTEMVSAKGLWYGDRKTGELLAIGEEEGPVGYQLFGSEPEILAHAVSVLSDGGSFTGAAETRAESRSAEETREESRSAEEQRGLPRPWSGFVNDRRPVLFDLNAGCPVPKIVRNGEGSALLKKLDLLHDCISAMCDASAKATPAGESPKPVTVKIRRGFFRDEDIAAEAAKAAEAAGASAVAVHGRSREQYYEGKADWNCIARVKEAVRIPVIGNGDVMSGADALRMMEETGCDGVMIARGALGNPWIFRDACALWQGEELPPAPDAGERIAMLLRHFDMVCADKGEQTAVREIRKHVGWYVRGLRGATRLRREVNTITDGEAMRKVFRQMVPDAE
ncbi:MAG: tRNA-dihydrouridine synthase [Firmicutes bacterium]|nr:tRNA-dihydrouridine synthase [Bacillota bacterium]